MQDDRAQGARRWLYAGALLALGALAGWTGARGAEPGGTPTSETSLATETVRRRDLEASVLATGVIRPAVGAQVAVGSRISGVLRRLHVTVGDRVGAGQLLAELDPTELETQLRRAEAVLANAQAERAYAELELTRTEQLAAREVATGAELSKTRAAAAVAQARAREAEAGVATANVQLRYARIEAPIAGVVGTVTTQEGETVAASFASPTFVTIVDLDRLEVWAYVDETDIGRIVVGQRARFSVDTYPGEEFAGRVIAVRPTAEVRDNVVNYITLIRIDSTGDRTLRPEMTATVHVEVEGRSDVLAVPNTALRRDAGGSYVLVASRSGSERRPVAVGFRGEEYSEVRDGLRAGERVVAGTAGPCSESTKAGAQR